MKRTGSELVLFNLLKRLAPRFEARLVTKYKGVLSSSLPASIATDWLYREAAGGLYRRVLNGLSRRLMERRKLAKYRDSAWYVNTVSLPGIIAYASAQGIRTILHLHELEQRFALLTEEDLQRTVHYPELIIANSQTSRKVLQAFGRTERIEVCYPVLEVNSIVKDPKAYTDFRKKLNIPSSSFLWVMCGTLDENKNPFLFIAIAAEICKTSPDTRFMWIGSAPQPAYASACIARAKQLGVSHRITWMLDAGEDYYNYFNCADGFVLTSRKESFSLVTAEALLLELPVVAQNCGGVTEVLEGGLGKVVEETDDPVRMAEEMKKYMSGEYTTDPERGKQCMQRFDAAAGAERWNGILTAFFQS